ncbi:phosphatase PAP2 family protein [Cohnella sp. GCM10012308]|uniref:phosphatase PAP2 family protein n=1 Tax=Cohnella sp. GCM10012308 TaxID=3317329 RepID=UPI003617FE2B
MKFTVKLSAALLLSILFAAGFGLVAALVGYHKIESLDRSIIDWFQEKEAPGLTGFLKFFAFIGAGLPVTLITLAIVAFLYFGLKHRRELILFVFVVAGSALLNVTLKLLFHRARPDLHRLIQETGFSFPSGHSMGAFSLYGILTYLLWKHVPVWWGRTMLLTACCALILLIGISRIYLGVHYPSDVFAGYLASGFWIAASIGIYRRYDRSARRG